MFNSNFNTLKVAMDVALKRQEIHSQNIANAETPNYKRKYIVFEELFNESKMRLKLKTTSNQHIKSVPDVVNLILKVQKNTSLTNDGNNVDIDVEIAEMVKNALRYQTLSRLMSSNIERYNTVIRNIR
ncbi:flagellar basal-body rod protein FlgB [Thermosipho melanesiensis]|uniref:Flagellar basal body rod protein FlgB n=2 Tax=Thermosipho melanesiensis TaxID=46541 RepID=A6LM28_THEM4|nr:flagellar basal body rod protein FlgB [Thermosipho melanesiensis]ABR30979.1 flagellar basal-body rod protein FlgB [Thermosipho melanesiensis BI429]APT74076.1 flagellar basal-body rod protein FlgB [Thermosipho melanesiensis]OOC36022.1 flagellar basal-body rod protein FlgB [Thermosipho melanesiensis]OOC36839.1 flagellar basal-body rod protein FlgB [Thermosipho melanesiensis]OOC37590.1 flagellar basal-body rod protein FlgB [Thermosipho melanesiensis]